MEQKAWRNVAIMIGVVAFLISINAIIHKNYFLGAVGVLVCIGLIILGVKIKVNDVKIPLYVIIQNYKALMEEYFQISLPKNVRVYFNEEVLDNYVVVLSYISNDSEILYYPFEAQKFTGGFGRGTGEFMKDIRDVEYWINKYAKTHKASEELSRRFSDQVAKRIREELEFNNQGVNPEERGER